MMQRQGEEKNANKVTESNSFKPRVQMSESGPLQETKKKEAPQGHQDRPYSKRVIQKDQNSAPQGQQYRLYRKESDPKGRKIVPQGHQDRLYRSRAQQQKQASRSPTTTSQNESTQKGSRMKPEVESSKNEGQKAKLMLIKKKKPRDI